MKGAFARLAAQCQHVSFGQLSGVHVASPIDEVMRFVNEEDMSATVIVEKAPQIGARVEDVVVVADDEIGIEGELERELERADAVLASDRFDRLAREIVSAIEGQNSILDAIVEAAREAALFAGTCFVRIEANLLFGRERNGFEPEAAAPELINRFLGYGPPRRARGEVEDLLRDILAERLDCGKERGLRLSNGCRSGIYNSINNLQVHYRWYVTHCL